MEKGRCRNMKRLTAWILTLILALGCLQSIPAAETGYGGHTYRLVISDSTWTEAFQEAINAGGYLVRFDSREEYQYVLQQINDSGSSGIMFRIGGRRDPDSAVYKWVDKNNLPMGESLNSPSSWTYSEWMGGEPSFQDGDIAECYMDIYYYRNEGRWVWNDVPDDIISVVPSYSGRIGYIIEFDNDSSQSGQTSGGSSWQDAYYSFITNQSYLSSGQTYGDELTSSYEDIAFALHDLNADGTPELIIFNGSSVYAGSINYLYQYTAGSVKYTGTMPGSNYNPYYYVDDPSIPGLFCNGAHTGAYWTDYYSMQNGYLVSEQVAQSTDSPNGTPETDPNTGEYVRTETLRTDNDALYNAYVHIKNEEDGNLLPFYTLSEINQMGWMAFLGQYGFTAATSGDALSDPAKLLSLIPDQFYFSSGAGAWSTDLTLHDDGSFEGSYHDADMGTDTATYPGGVMYTCEFSGKFGEFRRIDDYTWSMRLQSLSYRYATGQDWESDGVHYIASDAYGISGGDVFYIYMKGHPVSTLPEGYLMWARMYMGASSDNMPSALNIYGIYNVAEENGFGGDW